MFLFLISALACGSDGPVEVEDAQAVTQAVESEPKAKGKRKAKSPEAAQALSDKTLPGIGEPIAVEQHRGVGTPPKGKLGPLSMGYNNGTELERDGAGTIHAIWVDNDTLIYGRYPEKGDAKVRDLNQKVNKHAVIEVDGHGGVMVSWHKKTALYAMVSLDGGDSFGKAIEISGARTGPPTIRVWSTGEGANRQMAAVIGWHEGKKKVNAKVYAAHYMNGKFSAPVQLDVGEGASEFPTTGGTGDKTIMVWRDNRRGGNGHDLYYAIQDGVGGQWAADQHIDLGMDPSVCVTSKGEIHLSFQQRMQVYYRRSDDWGTTWLDPVKLGDGLFSRSACNDNGGLVITWEDMRYSSAADHGNLFRQPESKTIGLARSSDDGRQIVSEIPFDRKYLTLTTVAIDDKNRVDLMFVDVADTTVRFHTTGL